MSMVGPDSHKRRSLLRVTIQQQNNRRTDFRATAKMHVMYHQALRKQHTASWVILTVKMTDDGSTGVISPAFWQTSKLYMLPWHLREPESNSLYPGDKQLRAFEQAELIAWYLHAITSAPETRKM